MKKLALLFIVIFFKTSLVFAWQYVTQNYTAKAFNAHPLVWNFVQDTKGRLWMANNEGVLRFDGNNWNLYATPKPVRQMAFDKSGNLFLACEGDFGALIFDEKGLSNYISFKDQLGNINQTTLGEKKVFNVAGEIYFTSGKYIFRVFQMDNNFDLKAREMGEISGAFAYQEQIYINEMRKGLCILTNDGLKGITGGLLLKGKTIIGSTNTGNELLIATNYDGLFSLKNDRIETVNNSTMNDFAKNGLAGIAIAANGNIALGSFNNGVKVYDKNGKMLNEINLPSNEIYSLFFDLENNLWVAHRKGLTHVILNENIKFQSSFEGNITDILEYQNKVFVSTSLGLYASDESKNSWSMVKSVNGECWQLLNNKNSLLIASTNGLFEYKNGSVSNILPNQTIVQVQIGNLTGKIYAFGQEACYVLTQKNNQYEITKLEGLNELANSVYEEKNGEIWVGTYYNGLKKVGLKSFKQDDLLLALQDGKVIIRQYMDKPIFQSQHQVFVLNNNQFTENKNASFLFTHATNKNFDFTNDNFILTNNGIKQYINNQFVEQSLTYLLSGKPIAISKTNHEIWIAFDDKIYSITDNKVVENKIEASINGIKNQAGTVIFDQPNNTNNYLPTIAYDNNSFIIEFGINSMINPEQNLYRYQINGLNDNWSDWKNESKLSLTGLSPGKYTLNLEAKNAVGVLSEKVTFTFQILAPWYLTIYAYIIYGCLVILLVYLIIKINNKVLIKQNKKLEDTVNIRTQELSQTNSELTIEKKKSDDLLLNILPAEIAQELKINGNTQARQFENVTLIFTDFVNFTLISEKLDPQILVSELDYYFKGFDEIIVQNGLEKIKTIGDAYLAVCGMPHETKDHAKRVIKAAKAIREFTAKRKNNGGLFEVRIGVNTGPVIAGIVGSKKFAYDIWGDTVNTAARMEQNSEPGKINISDTTYSLVKNDFSFIHRGKIKAKNKGEMDMYFVE